MYVWKHPAGLILYGEFNPEQDTGVLLGALQRGCLGYAGMLITEDAVVNWDAKLRQQVGHLLQQLPVIYAADQQTLEWAPHYGINAKPGEHALWVSDPEETSMLTGPDPSRYEAAVWAARSGHPFYLRIYPRDGQRDSKPGKPDTYHPLHRFASRYGMPRERILYGDAPIPDILSTRPSIEASVVDQAQASAQDMIDSMVNARPKTGLAAELKAIAEGVTVPKPSAGRRRIELGTVFDPSEHYQADYYDGTGIEYMAPDGSWQVYHGTGLRWEGNALVAQFIREVSKGHGKRLLDFGCSAGDFVSHMHRAGWDAHGYDISQEAIDRAPPDVRHVLSTKPPGAATDSRYDHVTAFDLLEHIWSKDLDEVLAQIHSYLKPGGLFWANICTCGEKERTFALQPGVEFTQENSWLLVSGHVTIQRWWWWHRRLREAGFNHRDDLLALWQVRREEVPGFAGGSPSWSTRNFIVVEKPDA